MIDSSPKTILFIDHTAVLGGGEIALLHLVQQLDKQRFVPVVVLSSTGPLYDELRASGIETHTMPLAASVVQTRKDDLSKQSLLRLKDALRLFYYCRRLARFMRRRRVDLAHTNSLKSDIMGGVAARLARVPVVWHVRDRIADDYLPPKVARAFRWVCRFLPNYVIANSAATLETLQLPERQAARSSVAHDGIIPYAVSPQEKSGDTALIGIVGRISPWKGQHIFIEAAKLVHTHYPHAKFQIIGSAMFGEEAYEAEMRALATALDLDNCLEWTGFRSDVPELINKLDILVHASTMGEPFGQVIIEGMIASKPVVATNGGGVPEIVQDGVTGLLVPMGDAAALAKAIIHLLEHPQLARDMGAAGQQRVLEHFTIALTARRIEAVYTKLFGSTA